MSEYVGVSLSLSDNVSVYSMCVDKILSFYYLGECTCECGIQLLWQSHHFYPSLSLPHSFYPMESLLNSLKNEFDKFKRDWLPWGYVKIKCSSSILLLLIEKYDEQRKNCNVKTNERNAFEKEAK